MTRLTGAHSLWCGAVPLDVPVCNETARAPSARAFADLEADARTASSPARAVASCAVAAARVVPTGPHGSAAVLELAVNGLLATQVAVLAELLAGARDAGVDPALVLDVLRSLPVLSPAAAAAAELVLRGAPKPRFPVRLVRKDVRYLTTEAGTASGVATAVLAAFDRAASDGLGDADLTAVGEVLGLGRPPSAASA